VVHGFYAFHRHFGLGPVVNPVPGSKSRRQGLAHTSPIELPQPHRRARLRPKIQPPQPRAIPDAQWDELFARMRCARDRALLACYVSSGARASELLGSGWRTWTGRPDDCG
jgi:integrase